MQEAEESMSMYDTLQGKVFLSHVVESGFKPPENGRKLSFQKRIFENSGRENPLRRAEKHTKKNQKPENPLT